MPLLYDTYARFDSIRVENVMMRDSFVTVNERVAKMIGGEWV
jgi:hypothetical protein